MAQSLGTYSEQERIWSGPPVNSIYKDDTSLGAIVFNNMRNWPNNICQIWDNDGSKVTFSQALTWAIRIAQFLRKRGLTHKDVIGIVAENSKYLMPLGVACLMNGTPFHSPHSVLDEGSLKHSLSLTKPSLIFCDGKGYEKVHSATIEWQPEFVILTDHVEGVPGIESLLEPTTTEEMYQPEPLKEGDDQVMVILGTSGTTGAPKAVCISNRILIQLANFPANSETVCFFLPALDWLSGVSMFVMNTIIGCTRICTTKPFTVEHLLQLVQKYKVGLIFLAPRQVYALTNCAEATSEALSSLRDVFCGGGLNSLLTLQRFQDLCKNAVLRNTYALSEAGIVSRAIGLSGEANAVGRLISGVRARIVGDNGENLPHNQIGEIYLYVGPSWRGYYGNPEATRRSQVPEGWFRTGDLGYFDDQDILHVVDRCKEILKYQSIHYWPAEIENVISELSQVQQVSVVGIPNELTDDDAGALVVRQKGSDISAKEIMDHVARRLPAKHKQLHAGVQFVNELPANPNGKFLRKAAQELFIAQKAADNLQ